MAPSAIDTPMTDAPSQQYELPPIKLYPIKDAHFQGATPSQPEGYREAIRSGDGTAIVIDNGSYHTRAGWSFDEKPRFSIPPITAKFRKQGSTYVLTGSDFYADNAARSNMKYAFESGIVTNWDAMEATFDYIFAKMGIDGQANAVEVPVVMTEAVANLPYSRKTMTEIMFECYGVPSLAYGIDSLFSFAHNKGKTGLVVSSSHSSTHLIPVYNSKPLLTQATRLNRGGMHSAEYLLALMRLKYPTFPGKMSYSQMEYLVREHCYVSQDYDAELSRYLDWSGLEDRDHVIQYPFTEEVVIQKTEEELARIAEIKKASGRRLQEQAAKARLEKLKQKEENLEQYLALQQKLATESKKEIKRLLDDFEFRDEAALAKEIKNLETSIRKARIKDLGGPEVEEEVEVPTFELLEVPDDQLDEEGLKQKRHQRLMKSNHDARARAKAEKQKEAARIAEEARLDEEKRDNNREAWLAERHTHRNNILQHLKEQERLKADMGNRKSLASQARMKSIANLASDNPTKKRRRGNDDDTFGADDDDWAVYRDIATHGDSDNEDEEDMGATLKTLEADLLMYDPSFTEQDTLDAQKDWTKSLVHAFLRGNRPFDPASQAEAHQIHLNVERIRVPEVVFQPSIVGLDQAGLVEIAADILNQRLSGISGIGASEEFLKDVFLTGGNTLFKGFEERLRDELRAVLPAGCALGVRRAGDAVGDGWRGACGWVRGEIGGGGAGKGGSGSWERARVGREEYAEKGAEYIKEHDLGNAFV